MSVVVCRCSSSLSVHSSDTTEHYKDQTSVWSAEDHESNLVTEPPYTDQTSVWSAEDSTSIWSAEEHDSDVSYHSVWSCVGYSTSCATAFKLTDSAKCMVVEILPKSTWQNQYVCMEQQSEW